MYMSIVLLLQKRVKNQVISKQLSGVLLQDVFSDHRVEMRLVVFIQPHFQTDRYRQLKIKVPSLGLAEQPVSWTTSLVVSDVGAAVTKWRSLRHNNRRRPSFLDLPQAIISNKTALENRGYCPYDGSHFIMRCSLKCTAR